MNVFISTNFHVSMLQDLNKRARLVSFDQVGLNMVRRELGPKPISVSLDAKTAGALSKALSMDIQPSSEFEIAKSGDVIIIAKYHGPDLRSFKGSGLPQGGRFDFFRASVQ
jgi:hypothetical protein